VRDGWKMRQKTYGIVLCYAVSEEAGMEYLAKGLQPKVAGKRITYIASANSLIFL
jgi:hypothetical protein